MESKQPLSDAIFKRAAVAAAFSPRLNAVLNESFRLLRALGAWPIIVHAGDDIPSTRIKLEESIQRSDFGDHSPIFLVRQGNAADVLIDAAKEHEADLIVAGALKKEGLFKYYFGSVARNLARNAPCSVALFTEPRVKPEVMHKIHCALDYDEDSWLAVQVASNIAHYTGARELFFTHSFRVPEWEDKNHIPGPSEISTVYKEEDKRLKAFIKDADLGASVQIRSFYEKSRSVTLDFTKEVGADLLIVPSSRDRHGIWDRLFPHDLELALQNLPCSLLLVRQRDET